MDREDEILDVTPVFEYWFKKKSGNTNKQPAQIIASIVATATRRKKIFKNPETKLDISRLDFSRRNEAIKIYKEMEKMTEYTYLCSLVDKIITASKNLQKAKLRKYKYVKEMLDLVCKIKTYIPNIIKKFDHYALDKDTPMDSAKIYNTIADNIEKLKINLVDLINQKIGNEELSIKDNKDKFVIEVLAQLGYKNQMKFIGLNRTIKAKEREEQLRSEKASKSKFYDNWSDELKDIWRNFSNAKDEEIFPNDQNDNTGALYNFLYKLGEYLGDIAIGKALINDAEKILNPKNSLKDFLFDKKTSGEKQIDCLEYDLFQAFTELDGFKANKDALKNNLNLIMRKIRRAWNKKYRDDKD